MFDLDPTKEDEETKPVEVAPAAAPQSAYGALTAPGAAPAAPQHKTSVAPSFVNFDRYLNANKGALDAQRARQQQSVNSRFDALNKGVNTLHTGLQGEIAAGTAAPDANQGIARDDSAAQFQSELGGRSVVSREQAEKNSKATYGGPSQGQVDSRYAPLLAERDRLATEARTGGPAGGSMFDRSLSKAGGNVSYGALGEAQKAYDASYGGASKAVGDATTLTAENASKWGQLLSEFDTADAPAKEAEAKQAFADGAQGRVADAANETWSRNTLPGIQAAFGKDVAANISAEVSKWPAEGRLALSKANPADPVAFNQLYFALKNRFGA